MTKQFFSKITIFLPTIALVALSGCEKQGQVLALREEFSRQLQAKDKTIEDLNQKMNDLKSQNDQLQLQSAKSATDPDKLTASVADAVNKRVEEQNADMKSKIDQILQALKSGAVASGTGAGSGGSGNGQASRQPAAAPQRDPSAPPSDPSRKRMRFDF